MFLVKSVKKKYLIFYKKSHCNTVLWCIIHSSIFFSSRHIRSSVLLFHFISHLYFSSSLVPSTPLICGLLSFIRFRFPDAFFSLSGTAVGSILCLTSPFSYVQPLANKSRTGDLWPERSMLTRGPRGSAAVVRGMLRATERYGLTSPTVKRGDLTN